MCCNALHWLWHGRRWGTRWVFLLSVWSSVLLEEGFYLCYSRPARRMPRGLGQQRGQLLFLLFAPERCQTQHLARVRSTQRRPWTCARPSPQRSLGTSRARGSGVCGIMSTQPNKLCICLIDATHRLSRARSKLLQWITKLPWLQGSYFDLHHQHFTAADSHMHKHSISDLFNEVIWRRARVIYLFVPTSLRFTTLYKYKLGNLLSIFSRNALCRKQLSATGSCVPQSSSFRQREAS